LVDSTTARRAAARHPGTNAFSPATVRRWSAA